MLAAALTVLIAYAAFSHGAIRSPAETRLQLAVGVVALLAGASWLWRGTLRLAAPKAALAGVGVLAAFTVWTGVSLAWSVAADQSWVELNRAITYVIVLCLAIAVGASSARGISLIARGYLLAAWAVTIYALGQKLIPGLHISGVFDLNQTGQLPRLQEPLGYWNALSLFIAMGIPIALAITMDSSNPASARLGALVSAQLMVVALALTFSRGGVLALVLGLAATIALSGAWLRALMWIAAAAVAALPPLIFGLVDDSLTSANVALGTRELAGLELLAILAVCVVALLLSGRRLLALEHRVHLTAVRARAAGRLVLALGVVVLVIGLLVVTFSSRGLTGTVSHAWNSFTTTRVVSNTDPSRLLSADSENRWVWWREAAGMFSDRPIAGWGAGSFGVMHLLYRRDTISVQQPHSMPLQFLAETGLVGTILVLGGFALLFVSGVRTVRSRSPGERLIAAALLGGAVAHAVHSAYDWDWDIPAVTIPAIAFLGALAGARGRTPPRAWGSGVRALGLGALALFMSAFALSAGLPSLAATKASSSLIAASSSSQGELQRAQSSAALAGSLDPLSDAGQRAEATIAIHRAQWARARGYLLNAINRNPTDPQAWAQLEEVDLVLGHVASAMADAQRLLALDPLGMSAQLVAQQANLSVAPPNDSASASATPRR
jgi:hypothetical protein